MNRKRLTGVTLVELCFALMVAAVLAGLAAPAFRGALRAAAVRSAAFDLMADLQLTRGSAILENRPAVLCVAGSEGCESPAIPGRAGWHAYVVTADGEAAGGTRPLGGHYLPEGLELRATRGRLAFRPDSLSADAATLTICDATGVAPARSIVISRTGRPRFASAVAGSCRP